MLAAVDDAVGERDQTGHRHQHADDVDAARARVARLRPDRRDQQRPAHDRADRHGQADGAGPDADGPAPLARVEHVGDDRQGHRHDRRAADPHQGARRDQLTGILRVRGQQ